MSGPSSVRRRPLYLLSESERLHRKIELVLPGLRVAGRKLFTHPAVADLYAEYLFRCHCVVRAGVPLMEAALERAKELAATDEVADALTGYLRTHIVEELDHDEWLLEDLESLGFARSSLLARPPETLDRKRTAAR